MPILQTRKLKLEDKPLARVSMVSRAGILDTGLGKNQRPCWKLPNFHSLPAQTQIQTCEPGSPPAEASTTLPRSQLPALAQAQTGGQAGPHLPPCNLG